MKNTLNNENADDLMQHINVTQPKYKLLLEEFANSSHRVSVCIHPNNRQDPFHCHDFYEINYVKKGSCRNIIDNTLIKMKKGDLILIHPDAFHTVYSKKNCEIYNFLINSDWFNYIMESFSNNSTPMSRFVKNSTKSDYNQYIFFNFNKTHKLKSVSLANKIISIFNSDISQKNILLEATLMQLLCTLPDECTQIQLSHSNSTDTDIITAIRLYMYDNYSTVNLRELAFKFGYSKVHICRLFKEAYNKTFVEILTEIKLEHAKIYLENTEKKIVEISFLLGYESVEHFIRLFKKKTNYTPTQYRKLFQETSNN